MQSSSVPFSAGPFDEGFFQTSERLEKVVKATLKRNLERPTLDWSTHDAARLDAKTRRALGFFLEQLAWTEATSGQNLAALARSTPIAPLRAAYAAQMQDERAHGELLWRYLRAHVGTTTVRPHWANAVGRALGEVAQSHPLAGLLSVTMAIEYFAAGMLDGLIASVDEPLLVSVLSHIRQDEVRHKVLAAEAARVLRREGFDRRPRDRAFIAVCRRGADVWFREVFHKTLSEHAAVLGIRARDVYDAAREEMDAALLEEAGAA